MKLKIVSHNSAEVRTKGKLSATLIEASRTDWTSYLFQGHNCTLAQEKKDVTMTARNGNYHACVGHLHRSVGSVFFAKRIHISWPSSQYSCMSTLKGRVTTMELTRQEGKRLKVANLYVPAKPKERLLHLLTRLSNKSILEGVDICGIDANCVPDARIDPTKQHNHHTLTYVPQIWKS